MTDPYKGLRSDRAHDEISAMQSDAEQAREVNEAYAAHGGSPRHRAWRAITGVLRTEDRRPSGD